MRERVLDFLSAYYPRYLCSLCLAKFMTEQEAHIRAVLVPTISGLEHLVTECMHCGAITRTMRFKTA